MTKTADKGAADRIMWLDGARFFAILAVLLDHTEFILYGDHHIAYLSRFAVPLFVLVSGTAAWFSYERHDAEPFRQYLARRLGQLLIEYAIAVLLIQLIAHRCFDLESYLRGLFRFNASLPHYYILLHIQLTMAGYFLFRLLKKLRKPWQEGLFLTAVFVFSAFTTEYTNILDVYGGGGKLLGGTFLFLYLLAGAAAKHRWLDGSDIRRAVFFTVTGAACWYGWWRFMCLDELEIDAKIPVFGRALSVSGLGMHFSFYVMGIFALVFCAGFFPLIARAAALRRIGEVIAWIGRRTLWIFLYHRLFLDCFLVRYVTPDNALIKWILYFSCMLAGPLAIRGLILLAEKGIRQLQKME